MNLKDIVWGWDRADTIPPTREQYNAALSWLSFVGKHRLGIIDQDQVDALIRAFRCTLHFK